MPIPKRTVTPSMKPGVTGGAIAPTRRGGTAAATVETKTMTRKREVIGSKSRTIDLGQVPESDEPMGFIEVGAGLTIPDGNFGSVRVDVRVQLPSTESGLHDAYERASSYVEEFLCEEEKRWVKD